MKNKFLVSVSIVIAILMVGFFVGVAQPTAMAQATNTPTATPTNTPTNTPTPLPQNVGVVFPGNVTIGGALTLSTPLAAGGYVAPTAVNTATPQPTATPANGYTKVYRALLTQTGTNAPTATVLENTLALGTGVGPCSGAGEWSRSAAGSYVFCRNEAFPVGKTVVLVGNADDGSGGFNDLPQFVQTYNAVGDAIYVYTGSLTISFTTEEFEVVRSDDWLHGTAIEILIYP